MDAPDGWALVWGESLGHMLYYSGNPTAQHGPSSGQLQWVSPGVSPVGHFPPAGWAPVTREESENEEGWSRICVLNVSKGVGPKGMVWGAGKGEEQPLSYLLLVY